MEISLLWETGILKSDDMEKEEEGRRGSKRLNGMGGFLGRNSIGGGGERANET